MVAWDSSSPAVERKVDFAFKEEAIIKSFLIQIPVRNSWNILSPTTIVVYLSKDGIDYEEVARSTEIYPDGDANLFMKSSGLDSFGNAVNARVGVICPETADTMCGLIEVDFFGVSAPTPSGMRPKFPMTGAYRHRDAGALFHANGDWYTDPYGKTTEVGLTTRSNNNDHLAHLVFRK